MRHFLLSLMLASALVGGCGGDDDDDREEEPDDPSILDSYPPLVLSPGNVAAFATASAPNMFMIGIVLLAVPGLEQDPLCPKVTEAATEVTYEGGCTTMDGTRIVGKAVVRQTAQGQATINYFGWGMGGTEVCQGANVDSMVTYTGLMTYSKTATGAASFDLEVELDATGHDPDSCATLTTTAAYDYTGSFVGSETVEGNIDLEQSTTWNGSGLVGTAILGKLSTATQNEVVDGNVCDTEAASGTTTLRSGTDTAVITYDGASDCDMESTVQWSFNGAAQGELTGVRCSASPGPARPSWLGWGLALGLFVRRRRRE
ncbi:MAG TPA: hypothetical protein VFB62_02505 [Polyangiaceae bacterium]|nr:hypothetical protein [Polyangiaceae bacterium]